MADTETRIKALLARKEAEAKASEEAAERRKESKTAAEEKAKRTLEKWDDDTRLIVEIAEQFENRFSAFGLRIRPSFAASVSR